MCQFKNSTKPQKKIFFFGLIYGRRLSKDTKRRFPEKKKHTKKKNKARQREREERKKKKKKQDLKSILKQQICFKD